MSLLKQQYIRKSNNSYPIPPGYLQDKPSYEIDPVQLLHSIPQQPNQDIVIQQINLEIEELTNQLDAIERLKKLEKPLKKRHTLLASFLTKLEAAQKEIIDTNVTVVQSDLPVSNMNDFKTPTDLDDFLTQPTATFDTEETDIELSSEDEEGLETYRLQDFK